MLCMVTVLPADEWLLHNRSTGLDMPLRPGQLQARTLSGGRSLVPLVNISTVHRPAGIVIAMQRL